MHVLLQSTYSTIFCMQGDTYTLYPRIQEYDAGNNSRGFTRAVSQVFLDWDYTAEKSFYEHIIFLKLVFIVRYSYMSLEKQNLSNC